MLEADLTGSDAHGVFRLAGYVRQLKRGVMNPSASINVVERGPATALIDGDRGMGHVVMTHAAKLAVELARASGIGWVGARRSNHAGAGAIYAAMALEHGMVGIYGAASSVNHMAPWGGTEPLLGTNPIAVAIPAGKEAPVMLDIATSMASNGAIRTHAARGPADAGRLGAEPQGRLADHRSEPHQRRHLSADRRLQGQRALDHHRPPGGDRSTAPRSAATSAISPRRPAANSMSGNS